MSLNSYQPTLSAAAPCRRVAVFSVWCWAVLAGALTSTDTLVCAPWCTGPWPSVSGTVNPLLLHGSAPCLSNNAHATLHSKCLLTLPWWYYTEQDRRGSCISNMYSDANCNIYLEGNQQVWQTEIEHKMKPECSRCSRAEQWAQEHRRDLGRLVQRRCRRKAVSCTGTEGPRWQV